MKYGLKFELYSQSKSEKRDNVLSDIMDENKESIFNKIIYFDRLNHIYENGMTIRLENVEYKIQSIIYEFSKIENEFNEIMIIQVENKEEIEKRNRESIKSQMSALGMSSLATGMSNQIKKSPFK